MRRKLIFLPLPLLLFLCACAPQEQQSGTWEGLELDHSVELTYAEQFSVDCYQGGYQKITIGGTDTYLVIPEGGETPDNIPAEVTVLQQPLDSIYLVATSAMDLFRELDAIDAVSLSGTDAFGWYIREAQQAMEEGRILYAGKYSAPDYELILDKGCDLAVESTMIYHSPEVREQLERFGVPVLVERSNYEGHPLGRVEWIKLYGALLGKEQEAQDYFDKLLERLAPVLEQENTGRTVAFFFITANGGVNVRCSGDYIAKAIGLAGGMYAFPNLAGEGSAQTTMNIQMEEFYQGARDADIRVQAAAKYTQNEKIPYSPNIFKGRIYCAYCGKSLHRQRSHDRYFFRCISNDRLGKGACPGDVRLLPEEELFDAILTIIQKEAVAIIGAGCKLKQSGSATVRKVAIEKEIARLQQEAERDSKYLIHLYEDFVTGVLTHAEYTEMKDGYEQKIKTVTAQSQQLLEQKRNLEKKLKDYVELSDWLSSANGNMTLTGDLMDRLVDRVVVYSAQEIKVYFKFKDEFDEVLEND